MFPAKWPGRQRFTSGWTLKWDVHLTRITWTKTLAELRKRLPNRGCAAEESPFHPGNNPPSNRCLTLQSSWNIEVDPPASSLLKGQHVDFVTWGKEMKVTNTVGDTGKKLRKSAKQGCHPGNKSLQVHPHASPKIITCFEDEILERKWSLQVAFKCTEESKPWLWHLDIGICHTALLKISIGCINLRSPQKKEQKKTPPKQKNKQKAPTKKSILPKSYWKKIKNH